jgi:hypothetical protein
MRFTRVVSPVDIEVWNASSNGNSFVISYESRSGPGFHGRTGFTASWRPIHQNRSAIRVAGSPFKTLAEAEEACRAMVGVFPKKRSAYARKPSCFHLVHCVRSFCAEPAKPKPARILASGCHRRGFNHQSTPRSKAASVGLIDTATGFRSQLKTGLTSAPRLPQAERGSRSESLSSSGHPSALGASEWLQ